MSWAYLKPDFQSGFLVFLLALPLSLGISMASGFPPASGILAAIVGGLVALTRLGSPLTIKGPAAGLIAILAMSVETLGQGNMAAGVKATLCLIILAGAAQFVLGWLKAAKVVDFFPITSIHGMLATIGITIIAKQIPVLVGSDHKAGGVIDTLVALPRILAGLNPEIVMIGLVSLALLFLWPHLPLKWLRKVPAPMAVVAVGMLFEWVLDLDHVHTYLIRENVYQVGPHHLVSLPDQLTEAFIFPAWSTGISLWSAVPVLVLLIMVGSLESMMTVKAIQGMVSAKNKGNADQDLMVLGLGNMVSGLLGGLPIISEVVRSSANVNQGATSHRSAAFHALFLALFVGLAPGLLHHIPLASLAALLIYAGLHLASPKLFMAIFRLGWDQIIVFGITILVSLQVDLLAGIAAGIATKIILHRLAGAPFKQLFQKTHELKEVDGKITLAIRHIGAFTNMLGYNQILRKMPPQSDITIDLTELYLLDHSFLDFLYRFQTEHESNGGRVVILEPKHLTPRGKHPHATRTQRKTSSKLTSNAQRDI
jgi:MFS superfamily sulfate permease-like transporter